MQLEGKQFPEEAKQSHFQQPPTTRVVEGEENALDLSLQTLAQIENLFCGYGEKEVPQIFAENEIFQRMFGDLKNRGIEIRYVTEITSDNIQYCRQIIGKFGFKLRHLDKLKGNFAIADRHRQYWAAASVPNTGKLQLVWSDLPAIVEQNQFVFDLLWDKATPAEIRFREIEEGTPRYETRIIRDPDQILAETRRMGAGSRRYSISSVSGGLLYAQNHTLQDLNKILEKRRRGQHEGIRWLTTIDESSIEAAKRFLDLGIEIRHLDKAPTESFGLSEKEVGVTLAQLEGGALNNSALFSNEPGYVEHYSAIFDEQWKSGIDARMRIKEIEDGIEEPRVRIIRNRGEVRDLYRRMVDEASEEILLLLPTSNAYRRQAKIGIIDAMRTAVLNRGVKVRVLAPAVYEGSGGDPAKTDKVRSQSSTKLIDDLIEYKAIREATGLNTVTILVVDRTRSLIIEQQDDSRENFVDAIGVATYSSRGSTVKANIRFFERMWEEVAEREREEVLLEKERRSRMEAELLQDILAHDIRNYNQAARLNAELLDEEIGSAPPESLRPFVNSVINSIDGSTRLVDRAAKMGKILAEGSNVRLIPVNLGETIDNALGVVKKSLREKEIVLKKSDGNDTTVLADDMLQEVFLNLFSNSAKYTDGKDVRVEVQISPEENGTDYKISVIDYGHGVADELKPDIFTRYLKSARGSGLGLSIVHALVSDRYHGKIVVKNRVEGDYTKGTVIEMILPKAI